MKRNIHLLLSFFILSHTLLSQAQEINIREVQKLVQRNHPALSTRLLFKPIPKADKCDVFEQEIKGNKLLIKGSSSVALVRGYYDFIRQNGYGISSWTGNRCDLPKNWESGTTRKVVSPYQHHYYLNVVTYGYSMPYWDWNRWEKEIDWMALHGIDMPLALVANEAISARVFKKLGLSDSEIANYFVGPAHLPWMRMGNISKIDGPMPKEWHKDQIKLQHQILNRMRSLGMKPICPGFAGFVPKEMKRIFPKIEIIETSWGGAFHNWMLSPKEPLFHEIGKMFIQEWEKEFGKNGYYLVDSFNELEIPFPPKDDPKRYELLSEYGDAVYRSIKDGNKEAVWVMQGWMFGYQRHIWNYKTLEALVSRVPDEKMLLLDLAVDYNECFWHNGTNWDFYKGYYHKPWIYSFIPNMGGKSGMTGILSFYANAHLKALRSENRGQLIGYGMAPEGIENNEVIYELIADAGWSQKEIDLNAWLKNYSLSRYGDYPQELDDFWKKMQQSVYGSFTDHPRYNWQFRPGLVRQGSINANKAFYEGIERLAEAAHRLKKSPLFVDDFREWTVAYLGGKIELLSQQIEEAYLYGEKNRAYQLEEQFIELMKGADQLLATHPVKDLTTWLNYARQKGYPSKELADYYERNARRIVTIWGPPVDDYAARIWSGLIRDYYLPRWEHYFEQKRSGKSFDFATWERKWVEEQKGLSSVNIPSDWVDRAIELIDKAKSIHINSRTNETVIGGWTSSDFTQGFSRKTVNVALKDLIKAKGLKFSMLKSGATITVDKVELQLDGEKLSLSESARILNKELAFKVEIPNHCTGNNRSELSFELYTDDKEISGGKISLITQ